MRTDFKENPSDAWIEQLRDRFPTERLVDRALTEKMKRRSRAVPPPWSTGDVEAALRAFLDSRTSGPLELTDIRPLGGGGAKEQYRFTLRQDGAEPLDLVLRLQPSESIVETDRYREFQILDALKDVLPVPRCYWVDPDGSELGRAGFVYAFVDGVVRPPTDSKISSDFQLWRPELREPIGRQFIESLARAARWDWAGADLSAFEIPEPGTTQAAIAGLNWFERAWEEDSLEPNPLMTLAVDWLRSNAPATDRVSLVHNDLRIGNFLMDPESATITAILDWEMARFGDRHEDLAYAMLPIFEQGDETGRRLVSGFFERDEFLRIYEEASGLPVDAVRLEYYQIYHYWRLCVVGLGGGQRCVIGQRSSQDLLLAHNAREVYLLLGVLRAALERKI